VVTSDKALAESWPPGRSVLVPVIATAVAQLGWRKLQTGETVTPEQLEANYIRRSDAEILASPRG